MVLFCVFSIFKAISKVLFSGILDQQSYKALILNATELLDKFSFKEISGISKLMHSDLKCIPLI